MGLLDPAPPPGTASRIAAEAPKTRQGNTELGPFGPAWNLPSTVFFLKRDAMVRGRARVARLGPVRPATGKGQEGKDRLLEGVAVARPTDRRGGRGLQAGPQRAVSAKPTAADSPGAQVTVNSDTFWRSHFWAAPARCEHAPAHCGA